MSRTVIRASRPVSIQDQLIQEVDLFKELPHGESGLSKFLENPHAYYKEPPEKNFSETARLITPQIKTFFRRYRKVVITNSVAIILISGILDFPTKLLTKQI